MVDQFIRPVFQRTRLETQPKFIINVDTITSAIATHDIRPSPGQQWSLNYIQIFCVDGTGGAGGTETMIITLEDAVGSKSVILEKKTAANAGDTISFGSFGNGPLLLNNNFYLKTSVTTTIGAPATRTFDTACSVTEV